MQLHQEEEDEARICSKTQDNTQNGHRLALTCLCIDSKDQHVFTGSKDGSIIKWCLLTKKIMQKRKSIPKKEYEANKETQQENHTQHINCLAISTDDKFLASGGWDKNIRIWNPDDLSWIHTFSLHKQEITALVFRQGHHTLYSGSADRVVMLWTLEDDDNRCYIESLYGHESPITSIDTLRRERVLTSGGRDQSVRIWKIVEQAQTIFESKHQSVDIARFIDDQTFISGGEDGAINVWTTMKRKPLVRVKHAHGNEDDKTNQHDEVDLSYWISALATFSFRKPKHMKATKRRKVDEDELGDDVLVAKFGDEDDEVESEQEEVEADPDERDVNESNVLALVASGSCDSLVKVWHLTKNAGKYQLNLNQTFDCPGFVNDLRFTSDGKKLIAATGQEHRFGRWWKLKKTKNCFRVFDINKS